MSKKHLYVGLLLLGTAFWGISFTVVKVGVDQYSPFVFLTYKFLLACLAISLLFFRQLSLITRKTLGIGLQIGLPLLIASVLQTLSLRYTSVTNASFITGLEVLLVPLLKLLLYRKTVQKQFWLACGLALGGLYLITSQQGMHLSFGDSMAAAGAVGFAVYVLQVGRYSTESNPMPSVIVMLGVCTVGSALLALIDPTAVWVPKETDFWWGIAFAGLPATAYMYAVQNAAQRYIEEEKVALTYLCEPLFATTVGIVVLHEKYNEYILLGGLLIIAGMIVLELKIQTHTAN